MNPIQPTINPGERGTAVANLQAAILLLIEQGTFKTFKLPKKPTAKELTTLTTKLRREQTAQSFGEATQQLLRYFQIQQGLRTHSNGAVEDKTAKKLNDVLRGLGAFEAGYEVQGSARDAQGKPVSQVLVRAYDKEFSNEQLLGEARTDAQGRYTIEYTLKQVAKQKKIAADLVVKVFNNASQILATSTLHPNASARTTIDLTLATVCAEPTEYDRLVDAIMPRLNGKALADLTPEDIAFLATVCNQDAQRVGLLVESAKCARDLFAETSERLPEAVFYAWFRQGLPAKPSALLAQAGAQLRETLTRAVAEKIAPPLAESDHRRLRTVTAAAARSRSVMPTSSTTENPEWQDIIVDVLKQKRVERELASSVERERLTVTDLFGTPASKTEKPAHTRDRRPQGRLSDDKRRIVAELIAAEVGTSEKLLERIKEQGFEPWEVGTVQRGYALADLTHHHLPLVRSLQQLDPVSPDRPSGTLKYLARLTEEDWHATVSETGVPSAIAGASEAERQAKYAAELERSVESAFPTAVVAERIKQGRFTVEPSAKPDLVTFFENNQDFTFGRDYVQVALGEGGKAVTTGIHDMPRLKENLLKMERVIKITDNHREHSALLAYGFNSAHKVVQAGRRSFIDMMRTHPHVGHGAAAAIYDRAEHTTAVAATLLMRYRDPGINLTVLPRTDLAASVADKGTRAALKEIPDLRTLFGSLDSCACEACLSVLSPAAYFVDLMRFLEGKADAPTPPPGLVRVLTVNQVLAHTGTNTSGEEGVYVALEGSQSAFPWNGGPLELSLGNFTFRYSSDGTTMRLDLRFVLDGTPLAPVRVDNGFPRVATLVSNLAGGSHQLSVEVRSVWVAGPGSPLPTTLSGSPTLSAVAK